MTVLQFPTGKLIKANQKPKEDAQLLSASRDISTRSRRFCDFSGFESRPKDPWEAIGYDDMRQVLFTLHEALRPIFQK